MTSSNRRILIIIAIILVACLCTFTITAGFTISRFVAFVEDIDLPATSPASTDRPSPSTTDTTISPEIISQMALIESQVIELRGLQPSGGVTRALYTPADLRTRLIEDFFADYTAEEAAQDVLVLSLLGLVPADLDLHQIYIDLYSEGIAGFYDDDTSEMVVILGSGFGGLEQLTYAHEYIHVLQDQTYDLADGLGYNDETCEEDGEFCLALQALVEGDATLAELTWFDDYATDRQREEVFDFYGDYESPVYDAAPPFLQQDLLYAYTAGYLFVQHLYEQGGWPAVDAAYLAPPTTTEHILHPELYPGELPHIVLLPELTAVLGEDWQLLEEDTLGEWYTYMLLGQAHNPAARQNEARARAAAAGWGGDRYAVYQQDGSEQLSLVVYHTWDSQFDAEEFATAFMQYAAARFGDPVSQTSTRTLWSDEDGVHMLFTTEGETVWIFAPDEDTAIEIYEFIQEGA